MQLLYQQFLQGNLQTSQPSPPTPQSAQPEPYFPTFENNEPVRGLDDFSPLNDDEIEEIAPPISTRAKPINWTTEEEEDVTDAYIDSTEDMMRGNEQTRDSYWLRVTEKFNMISRRGLERSKDQVYSKWKDINKCCGYFNGFFISIKNSNPSGTNEADWIRRAYVDYKDIINKRFRYQECWEKLRIHPKWEPQPFMNENPPKRTKTNETNAYTTSTEPNIGEYDPEADLSPPPPPKRKGKEKTTSAASANAHKEDMLRHFDEYSRLSVETKAAHRSSKLTLAQEMHERQLHFIDKKEMEMDLDRFVQSHEHLTGSALRVMLDHKKRIAERWGWEFNP